MTTGSDLNPIQHAHVSMRECGGIVIPYSEQKFKGKNGKTHDKWSTPLCLACHADQHTRGEKTFWRSLGLNPLELAQRLWENTGNRSAALGIIQRRRNGATEL